MVILLVIALAFVIFLVLHEIVNIRDIKYAFTCEHCGTTLENISKDCNCKKCHRKMSKTYKSIYYFILFRTLIIDTKNTNREYNIQQAMKYSKIEILIYSVFIIILIASIMIQILGG